MKMVTKFAQQTDRIKVQTITSFSLISCTLKHSTTRRETQ